MLFLGVPFDANIKAVLIFALLLKATITTIASLRAFSRERGVGEQLLGC
jgi:hypothetical protein